MIYEYALACELLARNSNIILASSSDAKMVRCIHSFNTIPQGEQLKMSKAASAALDSLIKDDGSLMQYFSMVLPSDRQGHSGDPRDIVLRSSAGNEIGISCKNRSPEIKGLRISPTHSGEACFGDTFTADFMERVGDMFNIIDHLPFTLWTDLEKHQKTNWFYRPTIEALYDEFWQQAANMAHFTQYVLGMQDYYLVEKINGHYSIASYNFKGTLAWGRQLPVSGGLKTCERVRTNLLRVSTTDGWEFDIRVKNGDSSLKRKSLKLTISVAATPNYATRYEQKY